MIIKESDRKKYWCPFVQLNPANQDNQETVSNRAWKCVGSKCMAWRPVGEGQGYCGLAGQPAGAVNESVKPQPIQPQQVHNDYMAQNIPSNVGVQKAAPAEPPVNPQKLSNRVGVQKAASSDSGFIDMNPDKSQAAPKPSADHMDIIKQMSGIK
jgi:hypothetical protein